MERRPIVGLPRLGLVSSQPGYGDHPKKKESRTIAEEMELSRLEREKKARWNLAEKKPWRNGRRGSTGLAKTALIMLGA